MRRSRLGRGRRFPVGPLRGPEYVEDMLVLAVANHEAAFETTARMERGESAPGPLEAVRRYVERNRARGASLVPLHRPATQVREWKDARWHLAVPDPATDAGPLSGIHLLRLAQPRDREDLRRQHDDLQRELDANREQVVYCHRPAVRYPMARLDEPGATGSQWGLGQTQFRPVWPTLDAAPDPKLRAIGIIDQGGDDGHHELFQRITHVPPAGAQPSRARHAGAVAGVIAAIRDGSANERLEGCCSAQVHLFNVWRRTGRFDPAAYYQALLAVAEAQLPVLNLSMGGTGEDETEMRHIQTCLSSNVAVVAAMGLPTTDNRPVYPADYEGVIAVGGTDPSDNPSTSSRAGSRTWIAAPGDRILTVKRKDEYESWTGTSFAAAFVTAAVWLARRKKPCLTLQQIRDLLQVSVAPTMGGEGRTDALGFGRLDMVRLAARLEDIKDC